MLVQVSLSPLTPGLIPRRRHSLATSPCPSNTDETYSECPAQEQQGQAQLTRSKNLEATQDPNGIDPQRMDRAPNRARRAESEYPYNTTLLSSRSTLQLTIP